MPNRPSHRPKKYGRKIATRLLPEDEDLFDEALGTQTESEWARELIHRGLRCKISSLNIKTVQDLDLQGMTLLQAMPGTEKVIETIREGRAAIYSVKRWPAPSPLGGPELMAYEVVVALFSPYGPTYETYRSKP